MCPVADTQVFESFFDGAEDRDSRRGADRPMQRRTGADAMISVSGVGKQFGKHAALSDISLEVARGSVMCLLGHNGAGKTTLVHILATLIRPTSGVARIAGYDVVRQGHEVRRRIGITGQFASLDDKMSGPDNLIMVSRLLGADKRSAHKRAAELLDLFALTDAADRPVGQYSGGMRRRLDVAASLCGRPDVIFLDEPSTGLDPVSRQEAWRIIKELSSNGTTILLTTQDLEEADQLAQEITVLAGGRIVAGGKPAELKAHVGNRSIVVSPRTMEQVGPVMAVLTHLGFAPAIDAFRGAIAVSAARPEDLIRAATALNTAGIDYAGIALGEPTLQDVYLKLAVQEGK
jgi:ABC-2 type transport system ATP-binding protein